MAHQNAGWYTDPAGNNSQLRYWDGAHWTDQYSEAPRYTQSTQPQVIIRETTYQDPASGQVRYDQVYVQTPSVFRTPAGYYMDSKKQTLRLIAFILNIITTVSVGWLLIPLAWMLPMTIHSWGLYKGTKYNTMAFSVCTLLFLDLISGILLLVSGEDFPDVL